MTPRTLLLLRHAKSSWDDETLSDEARHLNERGMSAAATMGRVIVSEGLVPDRVLCSPARRAVETWNIVAKELPGAPEHNLVDGLYDFGDGNALVDVIRRHGGDAETLMLVGHNPAMQNLALRLAGSGPMDQRKAIARKFPTAALAVLSFDLENWSGLVDGSGEIIRFIRPKDALPT